jgi:hypothetical protein
LSTAVCDHDDGRLSSLLARPNADPDLIRVLTAWPDLPPHIKAAILALVGTAR